MHPVLDAFGKQNIKYQYRPEKGLMGHSLNHFLPSKKDERMVEKVKTYTSPYDMYKDMEKKGFIKMEVRPRVRDPTPRDFCMENPKDPRCKRGNTPILVEE
jgi:hypothetical protein